MDILLLEYKKKNNHKFHAIGFGDVIPKYKEDMKKIDIVFSIMINEFPKGVYKTQLQIKDFKPSDF